MKHRRQVSFVLIITLIVSLCSGYISAFAAGTGRIGSCQHHMEHTAECGYQAATEGSQCEHACSEQSGCVKVECVHEHDGSCGYIEGREDSCAHICGEESGCVKVECVHEHDAECGYAAATEERPCQYICPICDCVCISLCAEDAGNAECPVCAQDPQDCSFTTVKVELSFENAYAQYGPQGGTELILSGTIDGGKVTGAIIRIALSQEEAAMLTIPQNTQNIELNDNELVFTLEAGESNSLLERIPVSAAEEAILDISAEDIAVSLVPERYQNSPLAKVAVSGDKVIFIEKLPEGEGEYGSNLAYEAEVGNVAIHYVDREGNPAARQEAAPTFTLYYQVGEGAPMALQGSDLPFALAKVPEIAVTPGEDTWSGSVVDVSGLPSAVLVMEGGSYVEKPVSWHLEPSYPEDYYVNAGQLVEITEDNAANYPAGLGRGWYFIAGQEPFPDDAVMVEDYLDALAHHVYWADNGNADGKRPQDLENLYELQYAFDGSSSYHTLTENALKELGLSGAPAPSLERQGGSWRIYWNHSLPSEITYSDSTGSGEAITRNVNWRVAFVGAPESYSMVEVTEENAGDYPSVQNQYGTYYVLETSLTFTMRVFRGGTSKGDNLLEAFLEQFYLKAEYSGREQYHQLEAIQEDGHLTENSAQSADTITIGITNLWRYNLDNTRINYSIQEEMESADGRLEGVSGLEEGDYFAVSYNNSAVPSFSDVIDAVHGGGVLNLTLTGTVKYHATKAWLDDGQTKRPDVVMELWRYRSGESYSTASLVRNSGGAPYTLNLEDIEPNADGTYTIEFAEVLPKYDPEGYRYRYVVREYLSGENAGLYEQVFGVVQADGSVQDTLPEGAPREDNNTYLYNGGTLSNRLRDTVLVTVTKDWKAASFQSEFDGVMVEMRLQSRYKGSGGDWENTEYTHQMFSFLAENLTVMHTGAYPQYDDHGKELEYRWVEEAVYQGGTVVEDEYIGGTKVLSSVEPDGTLTFTLDQNSRKVIYRSISEKQGEENHTVITNSIANTIDYEVRKDFNPEWSADLYEEEYTFTLFRYTSGSALSRYATFSIDGNMDDEPPAITKENPQDSARLAIEQVDEWRVLISGLPEFDADGQQYEYILLEQDGTVLHIDTERDADGNYLSTVYNTIGEGNIIFVRKDWIDESDAQHRLPVKISVHDRNTNELIATATLGPDIWYELVDIGNRAGKDVYILETQVGEALLDHGEPSAPIYTNHAGGLEPTAVRFETQYHNYEATYSYEEDFGASGGFEGIDCFTVTNRRLGNINLTVTKNWVDGDKKMRQALQEALETAGLELAVRLDFMTEPSPDMEGIYRITRSGFGNGNGDIVTISRGNDTQILDNSGNWVDSIQTLNLDLDSQNLYFWNLPKYDGNGASVRYTIEEIFVDSQGQEVSQGQITQNPAYADVAKVWQEYTRSIAIGDYIVGKNHALDTQDFTLTNKLSAATDVSWYALWLDDFAYTSGSRPDIYLNIYARTHVQGEDGIAAKTELFVRNYHWEYEEEQGDEGVSEQNFWKCIIEGLPKYDSLGYEIDYFAVMNSFIVTSDFDYLETAYAPNRATNQNSVFATAGGIIDTAGEQNAALLQNVGEDAEVLYALQSGNTFVNALYDSITYAGEKLWSNLPGDYLLENLPTVKFTLNRSIAGENPEYGVASMVIQGSDWQNLNKNGHYIFELAHTGENAPVSDASGIAPPEGEDLLPRFDDRGRLYTYTIAEEILWQGTDAGNENAEDSIFVTNSSGQTIHNMYRSGDAMISAIKYLTLKKGDENTVYPAITLTLSRTFAQNDGSNAEQEIVESAVWSAAEVKAAVDQALDEDGDGTVMVRHEFLFDELPIYAPNGAKYRYTVAEDKAQLGGYITWAAAGDVAADALVEESFKGITSVSGIAAHEGQSIDASFLNQPEEPEIITLTGLKVWNDLSNAFGFRPDPKDGLSIQLERRADAQSGQGNAIGWQEVEIDGASVQIDWQLDASDSNQWRYTITGLERYAHTGMPWIYRITETVPEYYSGTTVRASQNSQAPDGSIAMHNLINSILTNTYFKKTWVDKDGMVITENLLGEDIELGVEYALQVRAREFSKTDWSQWENAGDYFAREIQEDTSGLKARVYTGTIRAALGSTAWNASYRGTGNSFYSLPLCIRAGDGMVYALEYRVVETSVEVYRAGNSAPLLAQTYTAPLDNGSGNYSYVVAGDAKLFSPYYGSAGADSQANSTREHKNMLDTTELVVKKVWQGDNNEIYITRPASTVTRYDWEVTFVVQRSMDGGATWQDIPANAQVTLYGENSQDEVNQAIKGLPTFAFNDAGQLIPCRYRVLEMQSAEVAAGAQRELLEEGEAFGNGYTVSYTEDAQVLTMQNTLQTTEFRAEKIWNAPADIRPSVVLELKYLKEGGAIGNSGDYLSFEPAAGVTLDGEADAGSSALYYAEGEWTAVWKQVPQTLLGSEVDANGHTIYRVFETVPGDYIVQTDTEGNATRITNTPSFTPSVTKHWLGVAKAQSVTVQLYRNIEEGTPESVAQVRLSDANLWAHTFEPQPLYAPNGEAYTYWVEEMKIDEQDAQEAAAAGGYAISYGGDVNSGFHVYNHDLGTVYVIKDWADSGNPDARPQDLELTLQRTTDPDAGKWETVTAMYIWDKDSAENRWMASFSGLPMYEVATGLKYTYRVAETVPEGYVQTIVSSDGQTFHFKNTLWEEMDIPVRKVWEDRGDHFGKRPQSITVELYVNGEPSGETLVLGPNAIESLWNWATRGSAGWSGAFKNLPKYDADGVEIAYTVVERDVPEGYEVSYGKDSDGALVITNTADGELTVTKQLIGNMADPSAVFDFTVQLSDETIDGQYGQMRFVQGAANFQLSGGQSLTASGLPSGIGYTVREAQANQGGYFTSSTGAAGTIPAGGTAQADFLNELSAISISGFKIWDDEDNKDGQRPNSITIRLYADGVELADRALVVTEADGWAWSFEGLPKYADGKEICYTIAEDAVAGYTASYDGYHITNSHTPKSPGEPPRTGDEAHPFLWAALGSISLLGFAFLGIALFRKRNMN